MEADRTPTTGKGVRVNHQFVPRSLDLHEQPDPRSVWRCVGCGLERANPDPRLDDDCMAEALPLEGAK